MYRQGKRFPMPWGPAWIGLRGLKRDGLSGRAKSHALKAGTLYTVAIDSIFSYWVAKILVKHFLFILEGKFAALEVDAAGDTRV